MGARHTIPLDPWEAQELAARRNGSRSNRERVLKAMELLRPVAPSLAGRCPRGWSKFEADSGQRNAEEAMARLRSIAATYDRKGRA